MFLVVKNSLLIFILTTQFPRQPRFLAFIGFYCGTS